MAQIDYRESATTRPRARMLDCTFVPDHDGGYTLKVVWEERDRRFRAAGRLAWGTSLDGVILTDPSCGEPYRLSSAELYSFIANGYDYDRESTAYLSRLQSGTPPRIAVTVRHSTAMGGGTMTLFRYVNWLTDLGAEVTVYSDDFYPGWTTLNARFHCITDDQSRYGAITEPVVIVYSVLELPLLLRHGDTRGKRILHLCQGAEEFHYGRPASNDLLHPIPIFDLLNSLPVGRMVVSPHLERYFRNKYGRDTLPVYNGVSPHIFKPSPREEGSDTHTILVSGNPGHPLKGVGVVRAALGILAERSPERRFRLINVCGELLPPENADAARFDYELRCGVTPAGMRELYCLADVVVNASWYEGFGLPALEAMACGTPVVTTDNHGLDGIAEDGRDCLVVPVGDAEAIATAIERLMTDLPLRRRLTQHAMVTAAAFSIDRQKEMFVSAVERLSGYPLENKICELAGGLPPTFSIIVPCYNQAHFLSVALDSIIAQTYGNWEAVVVNDGSMDSTSEVMERYARQDARIRCFQQANGGVASALNRGVTEARGEWICWLSSDDLFLPDKLACHLDAMENDPGLRFMHTNYLVLHDENGTVIPAPINVPDFIPPTELQVARFLEINYFNGISIAVHRSVFNTVGGFNAWYRYGQDYDLWLRASARFRSRFIDRATCVTRIHPGQGTNLFSEAGIYDSARAALVFLNRHAFEELFPLLDLGQPEQALHAVTSLLRTILNKDSFICRCGYEGALIDRMKEWLARHGEDGIALLIDKITDQVTSLGMSREAEYLLASVRSAECRGFTYIRHDWRSDLDRYAGRMERAGEDASSIRRYLRMVDGLSERNAPHDTLSGKIVNETVGGTMTAAEVVGRLSEMMQRLLPDEVEKFYSAMAPVAAVMAETGMGSDACLARGCLPLPVHYYSPVPDIAELRRRRVYDRVSPLGGIDWDLDRQEGLLRQLGRRYGRECNWPSKPTGYPDEFYTENNSFSFGCAAGLHCILRFFMPQNVIEVGSGFSSKIINAALAANAKEGRPGNYTIVDPYPDEGRLARLASLSGLVKQKVELLPVDFFHELREGDVLFVDSGHVVKTGGDVNFLILDVLPSLAPGVIIHFHDIPMPNEYPAVYLENPSFRMLWTESYLLQAFLSFNSEFEILFSMGEITQRRLEVLSEIFPAYDRNCHLLESSSLWLRRKKL